MMYRMIYDFRDKTFTAFFDTSYAANEAYGALKAAGATKFDCHIQTVDVQFSFGGKAYTYLAYAPKYTGATVMVPTPDGPKPATVVRSAFRTKSELVDYANRNGFPYKNFKTIEG